MEWDPDGVLSSRQFNTDTMKHDFFKFLDVWDRRPLKVNVGGMGFHHQFMLWYSVRRVQPKLIVESGMKSGATTWLLHEAAPTARIISFDPVIPPDWVSYITLAIAFFHTFQSGCRCRSDREKFDAAGEGRRSGVQSGSNLCGRAQVPVEYGTTRRHPRALNTPSHERRRRPPVRIPAPEYLVSVAAPATFLRQTDARRSHETVICRHRAAA